MMAIPSCFLLLAVSMAGGQPPASAEPSTTWEYRVLKKEQVIDLGKKDLAAGLNLLGGQGWELAAVDKEYIFKRARNINWNRIQDLKDRIALIESDVDLGKDRVGWAKRMVRKGFLSENQLLAEREWLHRAELALDSAQHELRALQPEPVKVMPAIAGPATQLALGYDAFDQRPGQGWRKLADEKKYLEAAQLIDRYEKDKPGLQEWQRVNLRFHAGQMYAFADRKELALARFRTALYAAEPADAPIRWNAYVRATIAFLEHDRKKLAAMREEIANGPKRAGVVPNLDVVDRLIQHFDEPYAVAYRGKSSQPK
jgi:hypothetical protein